MSGFIETFLEECSVDAVDSFFKELRVIYTASGICDGAISPKNIFYHCHVFDKKPDRD